jgi:hypothetical protein
MTAAELGKAARSAKCGRAAARMQAMANALDVMLEVSTEAMQLFLDKLSETLSPDEHAAMFLDQAGWHGSKALVAPDNITLVPLPAHTPQLNPVERVSYHLEDRHPSMRLHADDQAISATACKAWNAVTAAAGRLASLTGYLWFEKVAN